MALIEPFKGGGGRFLGWMATTKDGWEAITNLLKVAGIIIAPIVFYSEYRSKVVLEAKQRAIEEIKSFRASEEFLLIQKYELATASSKAVARIDVAGKAALASRSLCPYHKLLLSRAPEASLRREALRFVRRASLAASCANAGVCDLGEMCRALASNVHTYISDMCTVVADLEALWRTRISTEVRTWLDSCGVSTFKYTFCDEVAEQVGKPVHKLIEDCRPQARP